MVDKSNIYTRGGDRGKTSLLGGRRVPKHYLRIEAYGTIDELMAHTAMLRDMVEDEEIRKQLLQILDRQMSAASVLAAEGEDLPSNMPALKEEDVEYLESAIDHMDASLKPLTSFILPGGSIPSSQAHITRTVCRRAERIIIKVDEESAVDEIIIKYFNRLSDYYFLLSRKLNDISGVNEIHWKP